MAITRSPHFESSHRQFSLVIYLVLNNLKKKTKKWSIVTKENNGKMGWGEILRHFLKMFDPKGLFAVIVLE